MAPHDAFPAKGEDAWVAIAAEDDAGFAALAGAIGRPGLAADPRFATFAARKANEDALTAIVSEWTRSRDKHETAALLQAAGVLAAPVQDASDLFESAYLRARGLTQSVSRPAAARRLCSLWLPLIYGTILVVSLIIGSRLTAGAGTRRSGA